MRVAEFDFFIYQARKLTEQKTIREFFRWRAFSAVNEKGGLVIVLEEYVRGRITICEYDSAQERDRDIQILREIRENPSVQIKRYAA